MTATEKKDPGAFQIAQIFLQKAQFGYRKDPVGLPPDTKVLPQKISLNISLRKLNESGSDAQLTMHVWSNQDSGDETDLYDFEVEYAAVLHDIDTEVATPDRLSETGAIILYPFVRETVANLTMRGRFGPVWLRPLNIPGLFRDQIVKETAGKGAARPQE